MRGRSYFLQNFRLQLQSAVSRLACHARKQEFGLKQGGKELDRVVTVTLVPASTGLGVTVANIYGTTP
jgi:hypothetical protein